MARSFVNQFRIPYAHPVFCTLTAVAAVQSMLKCPRQIVAVDDAPNECFFQIKAFVRHYQQFIVQLRKKTGERIAEAIYEARVHVVE